MADARSPGSTGLCVLIQQEASPGALSWLVEERLESGRKPAVQGFREALSGTDTGQSRQLQSPGSP